jgi:hypothetical protein
MDDIFLVYEELKKTKFPTTRRNNVFSSRVCAFTLGDTLQYDKGRVKSKHNKKFTYLHDLLKKMMKNRDPDFEYTSIQLNKNFACAPHVDVNNVGTSYTISLGEFEGGNLNILIQDELKIVDTKNKFVKFNGKNVHWVSPFKGERYSLVFYKHNFKMGGSRRKFSLEKFRERFPMTFKCLKSKDQSSYDEHNNNL